MVEGISRPDPENTKEEQYGVRISRASGIECPFNSDNFDLNKYRHAIQVDDIITTPLDEAWTE